jgi:hypothetical protein
MNHTTLIFTVFSFLVGILVFAIWSNTHVFAQQLPSSPRPAAGSSSSLSNTTISPVLKAKMCNPSNPSLKVVNTTESKICGISKTVKPPLLSSSATPPQQITKSTKPTTTAAASVAAPKQQQIASTNNNTNNTVPRSTSTATAATMAPVSNASNRSLSISPIAPQVNALSQQQQPPITGINSTAGQNYTSAATSPVVPSGKLLYLGYHGSDDGTPTNDGVSSKHKSSSSDTKTSTHRSGSSSSTTTDNDSTEKKKASSSHTNDDGGKSSSPLELASAIRNKVDSIIKNSIGGIIDNTPFLLPFH